MRVGFTGTRDGMTERQVVTLNAWLERWDVGEFHHGACVGADAQSVSCCRKFTAARVVAHPPERTVFLSWQSLTESDETLPGLPYEGRNAAIVAACDVLLACPDGPERARSGTWMTVRKARKAGKPVVIFWPDGSVAEERNPATAPESPR